MEVRATFAIVVHFEDGENPRRSGGHRATNGFVTASPSVRIYALTLPPSHRTNISKAACGMCPESTSAVAGPLASETKNV